METRLATRGMEFVIDATLYTIENIRILEIEILI